MPYAACCALNAASAAPTTPTLGCINLLMNATTVDRQRAVVAGLDSTGTGIAAAGLVGQLDDTATTAVTENQFAVARLSTRRALLIEGVASGTNVNVNLAASAATVTVDTEMSAAAALADGASAAPTTSTVGAVGLLMNATTVDRQRAVVNALDSTGTGIAAAGLVAQLDDTAPSSVTENQFGTLRMSTRRALLIEGVASGTNVNVNLAASAATVTVDSELPAAAALADAASATPTTPTVGAVPLLMNATTVDRQRAVLAGLDSTGIGIAAAGLIGQLDDVATTAVTENQFAAARISTRRALLVEGVTSGTNLNVNLAASAATVTVDTEMSAAVAAGDAMANPTTAPVISHLAVWGGTTWSRVAEALNTGANIATGAIGVVPFLNRPSGATHSPMRAMDQLGDADGGFFFGGSAPFLFNGTTYDRERSIINAINSIGTGIASAGLVAQFDDTAPTTITENQFGAVRMSSDRRLYVEQPYVLGRVTADGQIKGSAGFVHTITISPTTATPTAGLLSIYNSLTETGTVIYSEWIFATTPGHTVLLDLPFDTGLYVGYDAALANVACTVAYR